MRSRASQAVLPLAIGQLQRTVSVMFPEMESINDERLLYDTEQSQADIVHFRGLHVRSL